LGFVPVLRSGRAVGRQKKKKRKRGCKDPKNYRSGPGPLATWPRGVCKKPKSGGGGGIGRLGGGKGGRECQDLPTPVLLDSKAETLERASGGKINDVRYSGTRSNEKKKKKEP